MKKLSYLPNVEGFEFLAIYKNGQQLVQQVKRKESGSHYIDSFNDIAGWLYHRKPS